VSPRYDVSPVALDDLDAAAAFIAEKSARAAERFLDEIYDSFEALAANPHLGHRGTDLTSLPVFFWTAFKGYAVIYRKTEPLQVVRVLAWKQDVSALLSGESGFAQKEE
jgi:plasmid stabilization system protein ParE